MSANPAIVVRAPRAMTNIAPVALSALVALVATITIDLLDPTGAIVRAAAADTVERRGQERDPNLRLENVTVIGVGDDGVRIVRADETRQVVPLDRVREIRFDAAPDGSVGMRAAGEWARYQPLAIRLWRARSRVERGDTALAEPLLEELFFGGRVDGGAPASARPYLDGAGETALVVAEGLLRCRLARGDQAGAILPALVVTRLRRQGVATVSYSNLPSVWDAATGLCPQLPPVLPEGPGTAAALAKLGPAIKGDDALVVDLAALYAASIVIRSDGSLAPATPPPPQPPATHDLPASVLLRAMLQTQQGDATARAAARAALHNLVAAATKPAAATKGVGEAAAASSWLPAWTSFAEGCSLLRDDPGRPPDDAASADARRRGVVALLAVPARSARTTPWLAGAALVVAGAALEGAGDRAAAATIRRELDIEHPYHPLRAGSAPRGAAAAPSIAGSSRGPTGPAPRKDAP